MFIREFRTDIGISQKNWMDGRQNKKEWKIFGRILKRLV